MLEPSQRSRFRGAMLGFALGDSLGMPAVGLSSEQATALFQDGIRPLPGPSLPLGEVTAVTLLMKEAAESLIACKRHDAEDLAGRLVSWHERGDLRGAGETILTVVRRLKRGRLWRGHAAAGRLAAAGDEAAAGDKVASGYFASAGYRAAGCGAVALTFPVALLNAKHPEQLAMEVSQAALVTHRHPEAVAGAVAYATALAAALSGAARDPQIEGLFTRCARAAKGSETAKRLKQAEEMAGKRRASPKDTLALIGASGYAAEAVPAAIYSFLFFPSSFREAVGIPLMCGGAASLIAALTGGLVGAFLGLEGLPTEWLATLEGRDRLDALAEQLASVGF
ncbi:MAG: ADP-ribosylglycohydrolase family protein [bacterium]